MLTNCFTAFCITSIIWPSFSGASKIESLYYTILLLQAYDVILPESDVMFRLAEHLGVMKDSDFTPENESQIIDVIQKAVKQLVNM